MGAFRLGKLALLAVLGLFAGRNIAPTRSRFPGSFLEQS